ncbi:GGDEF domain-containing protein [Aureimonas glaciei]|uniref:diguanylate cyclase n=1 Tax=Aureimonas glaciei TaxID=1776957 RepID=A0A917D900_9HYPH|nr:GGDEF domain-containing protein [Aureimonas glaciei]GGD10108.1 GGDEF domain-containing protein [Aureimonas glaciei]
MHIDVPTLYLLIVGTTFVAGCLTVWERQFNAPHRRELGLWALGYLLISAGCLVRIADSELPGFVTVGLSNVAVGLGYAVICYGAVLFSGRRVPHWLPMALVVSAFAWLAGGYSQPMPLRIALTSALTGGLCLWAAAALSTGRAGGRPSQKLAGTLFAFHGGFFAVRALVTSFDLGSTITLWGSNITVTMFEGILWSAAAPMALLVAARERTERALVADCQTDYLTDLDNRRAFFEKGERLLEKARRDQTSVVLLAFDLDHFKAINDRFGHSTGDTVLRLFAGVAREVVGKNAVLARLGGEEFAAVLPVPLADSAHDVASHVMKRFAIEAARPEGLGIAATVSIGIAGSANHREGLSALLSAADAALYRAKALGRNRIERALPHAQSVAA